MQCQELEIIIFVCVVCVLFGVRVEGGGGGGPIQNSQQNLNLSYEKNLDFGNRFGRETPSYSRIP